jgi:hypothetical protein
MQPSHLEVPRSPRRRGFRTAGPAGANVVGRSRARLTHGVHPTPMPEFPCEPSRVRYGIRRMSLAAYSRKPGNGPRPRFEEGT